MCMCMLCVYNVCIVCICMYVYNVCVVYNADVCKVFIVCVRMCGGVHAGTCAMRGHRGQAGRKRVMEKERMKEEGWARRRKR